MIPVIVVSARDACANKERAPKAGAKAYVQRPWNDSELLALIRLQLGQTVQAVAQPVSFSKNRLKAPVQYQILRIEDDANSNDMPSRRRASV